MEIERDRRKGERLTWIHLWRVNYSGGRAMVAAANEVSLDRSIFFFFFYAWPTRGRLGLDSVDSAESTQVLSRLDRVKAGSAPSLSKLGPDCVAEPADPETTRPSQLRLGWVFEPCFLLSGIRAEKEKNACGLSSAPWGISIRKSYRESGTDKYNYLENFTQTKYLPSSNCIPIQ